MAGSSSAPPPIAPLRLALARSGRWAALEIGRRRLFLLTPVCLGIGILLYFAADGEPSLAASVFGMLSLAGLLWLARRRFLFRIMLSGVLLVLAGLARRPCAQGLSRLRASALRSSQPSRASLRARRLWESAGVCLFAWSATWRVLLPNRPRQRLSVSVWRRRRVRRRAQATASPFPPGCFRPPPRRCRRL